jgi:hypothetical protein
MTYDLRVRVQVEADIESPALWYERRQPGLGEFVNEIRQATSRLAPQASAILFDTADTP